MGERWEGPYLVKEFDSKRGGYKLEEVDGRLLKDYVPIEHLKLVEKYFGKRDEMEYEVEKVVNHRGKGRDVEFEVKWKGSKETTWEGVDQFTSSIGSLEEYWKRVNKKVKGNKK